MTGRTPATDHEVHVVGSVPDAFAELAVATLDGSGPAGNAGRALFLSGGPTAERCYRRLAELCSAEPPSDHPIDWSAVDVYMGDERCVPPDHPDSNHRMVRDVLLGAVGPVRSDHPMYRSGSAAAAAEQYQREIEVLDRFDLVHLGLGPDGHCASLFPNSAALAEPDPAVLVLPSHDPQGENPHDRITLTLHAIARARLVVFTVSGESKRRAFEAVMAGDDLPASRVTADRVVWLVDTDAAGAAG